MACGIFFQWVNFKSLFITMIVGFWLLSGSILIQYVIAIIAALCKAVIQKSFNTTALILYLILLLTSAVVYGHLFVYPRVSAYESFTCISMFVNVSMLMSLFFSVILYSREFLGSFWSLLRASSRKQWRSELIQRYYRWILIQELLQESTQWKWKWKLSPKFDD